MAKKEYRYTFSYWDEEGKHPHFAGASNDFAASCAELDQHYQEGAVRVCLVENKGYKIVYERRLATTALLPTVRERPSVLAEDDLAYC